MSSTKDISTPKLEIERGSLHPINQMKDSLINLLISFGFEPISGPEIESEKFNFDMLNIKKSHPARQMHDTFYVENKTHLLRTHTSPVQIRAMFSENPPFSYASGGKVYRKDDDSTHLPMFHQVEGIHIDKEELLKEKFKYLRKLEDLEKKGIHLTKSYDMESSLSEMQGEYETIISEKERSNAIKFQGRCLTALITGIEFLNGRFDPFDIKLDGWSEQINENIDDYDEIFGELHEKYKSKATMAPELKLVFQLGASGMMLHMTNTMFKSAMPGMDDIMRQNPELAEQFTRAAVDSMSSNSPGFSGFMNNMMNDNGTQNNNFENMNIPPSNNRPDLNASKQEVDIEREDMKGPSDISSLLNNLKPKTNIRVDDDVESTISIEDLKEISNKKMPKSVSKKRRSSQNTVSLDI